MGGYPKGYFPKIRRRGNSRPGFDSLPYWSSIAGQRLSEIHQGREDQCHAHCRLQVIGAFRLLRVRFLWRRWMAPLQSLGSIAQSGLIHTTLPFSINILACRSGFAISPVCLIISPFFVRANEAFTHSGFSHSTAPRSISKAARTKSLFFKCLHVGLFWFS